MGRPLRCDARMLQAGVMSLVVEGRQYRCVLDGDGVVIGGRRFGFEVEDPRSLRGRRGAGGGRGGAAGGEGSYAGAGGSGAGGGGG